MDEKRQAYLEGFEQGARQVISRMMAFSQELTEELVRTLMAEQSAAPQNIEVDMGEVLGTSDLVSEE